MARARDILHAARAATVWLLMVVCMFLGPASAFATDACCDACPYEEAEHEEAGCDDEQSADEHGTPPDPECPEDCPGCHSNLGVALTSSECSLPRAPPSSSTHGLAPSDPAPTGVCTGVFRPPRSPSRTH